MSAAPHGEGRVTIADVAKSAGVATSTVSRALSRPGRVSEPLRQKIVAIANELGYYPSPQARSLKSGRTHNVALLIPDITNPFFFGLVRATQAQARARGYLQFVVNTEESAGVEAAYLAELGKSVDGVILAASRLSDDELASASRTLPIVTINRDIPNVPSVIIDTPAAMVQALDHLVSLGHTSIAYLSGPESSWSSRKRWSALQQAARTRAVHLRDLGPFAPTVQAGAAAADATLATETTACICFNDLLAIGVLQRLGERGVRVPQDMSVMGCDDIFGADFCNPPLTTFSAPLDQAGRLATDMLMSLVQDLWGGRLAGGVEGRRHERLSTYLTIRDSTGPAPSAANARGVA